jgi:glutathione reductase (NADPH)
VFVARYQDSDPNLCTLHRPLEQFDPDLVDRLVARTRELGVDVRLGADVRRVTMLGDMRRVDCVRDGKESSVEAELVVHGAGRVPDLDELNLAAAGVEFSSNGVAVNDRLQSVSNPMVYAAGDCADTPGAPLTPVAGYEGRMVAANLVDGIRTPVDYEAIPSVAFTIPPIARVGLGEAEARATGVRFRTRFEDTSGWYSSRRVGEPYSASKVLIEERSERMLGAHLFGPHADETINLFALGIRLGVSATQFKHMLWAYPTHGSDTSYMV